MTAQIQALTNTVAMLSTAIAAAAKENGSGGGGGGRGDGSGRGGRGGRGGGGNSGGGESERTFKFMAIILLAQITSAQHALTNVKATTTLQLPTPILEAAISGRDSPRSSHPSMTTSATKANQPTIGGGRGWMK